MRYLHDDNLGSVDLVTDEGGVSTKLDYEPYGTRMSGSDPEITKGFTFHEHDAELGLINMKGRIYDPKLARFLAPDPIVGDALSVGAWNPYSYVENNPVSRTDPSGFCTDLGRERICSELARLGIGFTASWGGAGGGVSFGAASGAAGGTVSGPGTGQATQWRFNEPPSAASSETVATASATTASATTGSSGGYSPSFSTPYSSGTTQKSAGPPAGGTPQQDPGHAQGPMYPPFAGSPAAPPTHSSDDNGTRSAPQPAPAVGSTGAGGAFGFSSSVYSETGQLGIELSGGTSPELQAIYWTAAMPGAIAAAAGVVYAGPAALGWLGTPVGQAALTRAAVGVMSSGLSSAIQGRSVGSSPGGMAISGVVSAVNPFGFVGSQLWSGALNTMAGNWANQWTGMALNGGSFSVTSLGMAFGGRLVFGAGMGAFDTSALPNGVAYGMGTGMSSGLVGTAISVQWGW